MIVQKQFQSHHHRHRSVKIIFHLRVPREKGLVAWKTGCPLSPNLIIINLATRSHFPPGLSDQRPAGNLFANRDTSLESAIHSVSLSLFHHMMSLNIDMKIIRRWNCSGSPILLMNFWTSRTSCNVMNPGKYSTRIPSVLRQLCPKVCIVMIFEPFQLSLPNNI